MIVNRFKLSLYQNVLHHLQQINNNKQPDINRLTRRHLSLSPSQNLTAVRGEPLAHRIASLLYAHRLGRKTRVKLIIE